MTDHPLMVCGHAANAVDGNGNPSCAICCTSEIDDRMLSLEGRMAKCSYSHLRNNEPHPVSLRPSSDLGLAFFEYRGPGSAYAIGTCKHCHYNIVAHDPTASHMARVEGGGRTRYENFMREHGQHEFEPIGPAEYDLYYCGCWGWD
jgi:hypothetical protein